MKTITVRIAAAVDSSGDWCAYGDNQSTDEDNMRTAAETLIPGENRYILVATLAIPEVTEINATVEKTAG